MRHVTRLCIGATAAMSLSVVAQAADLRAPVSKAPAITWTGWYVGATAGYGWSNSHVDPRGTPTLCNATVWRPSLYGHSSALSHGPNSLSAAQAAASPRLFSLIPRAACLAGTSATTTRWTNGLWSRDRHLLDEYQWIEYPIRHRRCVRSNTLLGLAITSQAIAEQELRYFGTVRGRVGYLPADTLLLFVTGGLAYAQVSSSLTLTEGSRTPGTSATVARRLLPR